MDLLILGGTGWLGGTMATTALGRGHAVTCLARGHSGKVPAGAKLLRTDRDQPDAYAEVASRDWGAVVDVSRQPGQVRRAAEALGSRTTTYVFVSSGSVYADHSTPGQDETAPLLPPLEGDVMRSMEEYGEAKVACERRVLDLFGAERALIVRAGLIGGPGDASDRVGRTTVASPVASAPRVRRVRCPGQLSCVRRRPANETSGGDPG